MPVSTNSSPTHHGDGESLAGLHEAVAPGLQLRHVGADLVHRTVQVTDCGVSEPRTYQLFLSHSIRESWYT